MGVMGEYEARDGSSTGAVTGSMGERDGTSTGAAAGENGCDEN